MRRLSGGSASGPAEPELFQELERTVVNSVPTSATPASRRRSSVANPLLLRFTSSSQLQSVDEDHDIDGDEGSGGAGASDVPATASDVAGVSTGAGAGSAHTSASAGASAVASAGASASASVSATSAGPVAARPTAPSITPSAYASTGGASTPSAPSPTAAASYGYSGAGYGRGYGGADSDGSDCSDGEEYGSLGLDPLSPGTPGALDDVHGKRVSSGMDSPMGLGIGRNGKMGFAGNPLVELRIAQEKAREEEARRAKNKIDSPFFKLTGTASASDKLQQKVEIAKKKTSVTATRRPSTLTVAQLGAVKKFEGSVNRNAAFAGRGRGKRGASHARSTSMGMSGPLT